MHKCGAKMTKNLVLKFLELFYSLLNNKTIFTSCGAARTARALLSSLCIVYPASTTKDLAKH